MKIKKNNWIIEKLYGIETQCDGLIQYIIRKCDGKNIATLDRFSTEVMQYGSYNSIMETITCEFIKNELYVLQYFFGEYFEKLKMRKLESVEEN